MRKALITSRSAGRIALVLPFALALGACQHMRPPHGEASNGAQLAAQFIKPVDGKLGIIVGADGELTVVDLNGNIVPECRLSGIDHSDGKEARQAATDLPTCRGTIGTTIKKVTPISVTNHTGSNCYTISGVSSGTAWYRTFCY